MSTIAERSGGSPPADTSPPQIVQGVIEEAHRRRRARRRRAAVTLVLAVVCVGGLVWALASGTSGAQAPVAEPGPGAAPVGRSGLPRLQVRLMPTLAVGHAGWCVVVVERGITGGSACGSVLAGSAPFLQVFGWGQGGSPRTTQVAVTAPQVVAVRVGRRRVRTVALRGLPYGLRAVRVVTGREAPLRALASSGRTLPALWTPLVAQAAVRNWRAPARAPRGVCSVRVQGVPGLVAQSGAVARSVRPFPARLVGSAFLPCAATTFVQRGVPITVTALVDAARPGAAPGSLPDFHAVRRLPGVFSQGGLVATRDGAAWLVVAQGSGVAGRLRMLAHASARISVAD